MILKKKMMNEIKTQIGFYVYIHRNREFFVSEEEARIRYTHSGWKITKSFSDDTEELIKEKRRKK